MHDTITRPRCLYCRAVLTLKGYTAPGRTSRPVVLRICAHCDREA